MAVVSLFPNYQLRNSTGLTGVSGMRNFFSNRSTGSLSSCSESESSRGSMPEIKEEEEEEAGEDVFAVSPGTPNFHSSDEIDNSMFVAVGKEFKESKSTLLWVLFNNPGLKKLVLVHVHRPSPLIPLMGAKFKPEKLESKLVDAHRQYEMEKRDKILDEYVSFCRSAKKSSKAIRIPVEKLVIEMDDVAKGLLELIAQNGITNLVMGAAADKNYSKKMKAPKSRIACTVQKEAPASCKIWFTCKENLICVRKASSDFPESSVTSSDTASSRRSESIKLTNSFNSPEFEIRSKSFNDRSHNPLGGSSRNDGSDLYLTTRDNEVLHVNVEPTTRITKDFDNGRASTAQELQGKEIMNSTEVEVETPKIKSQWKAAVEELRTVRRQKSELECRVSKSEQTVKDIEDKLSHARDLLKSLQRQKDELQRDRDDAIKEVRELQRQKEEASSSRSSNSKSTNFLEFSSMELQKATWNFDRHMIIGRGGYGNVYKGYIHHTPVAIKILDPGSLQGQAEFHQEIEILSRVRHPNLVTLVGACSGDCALIYEFLPNGSLEDRLLRKEGTPPLSWRVRTRICYEVCCALMFLHSAKPSHVVHGDLKPANILLDANFVSKLSDFGISRLLIESKNTETLGHLTDPKGTIGYLDPEFQTTGVLTPRSDVYSFGVILLRLLTGRPALGISNEVQEAVNRGRLQDIIDRTAGEWPLDKAEQLALLGIRCCEMNRKNRPDLSNEVWRLQMRNNTSPSLSSGSFKVEENAVPSYFICPVYQEIMKDPCVAADGYTYEAEAMRKWFESGKKVSPITKLGLAHEELLPNHALRAAIQDWRQQQRQP